MPAQLTYGTAGATGGGFSGYKGLQPLFREEHLASRPSWGWQRRSPSSWRDPNQWESGWSWGCKVGGGDDLSYSVLGIEVGHGFEPFTVDGPGNQSKRFIKGITKDAGGTPVANAIVQGFVTSTDAYVGEVTSGADGTYTLGTETVAGVAHYLVAYKAGSPDIAGTTVNTLTSTNVDGT
jgi:hypothetical protein